MTDKPAGKLYRVLVDGAVSQREGLGFVERKKGAEISLSLDAAAHLLAEKLVEEVGASKKAEVSE